MLDRLQLKSHAEHEADLGYVKRWCRHNISLYDGDQYSE